MNDNSEAVPTAPGMPSLVGVKNLRDLGGLRGAGGVVRSGLLLRSGHLATATNEDVDALASLGLHSVVDFRQSVDMSADGGHDRLPEGVESVLLPLSDPTGIGAEMRELLMAGDNEGLVERFGDGKADVLAREHTAAQATDPDKQATYAAFMAHIVDAPGPVLFHCSAGKDRAGWAATLLGMALGVDDEQLMEHYLLSNVYRPAAQRIEHYRSRGVNVEVMLAFLQVDESYLRAALAAVDAGWESRDAYLTDAIGVGPDDRSRLRERYLKS